MYIFSFFVLLKLLEKTGPKRGPFLTPCADMPRLGKKKCVRIAWSRHEGSRAGGVSFLERELQALTHAQLRGLGECCGVWDRAPAEMEFGAFWP